MFDLNSDNYLLNETWLRQGDHFQHSGYKMFLQDRDDESVWIAARLKKDIKIQ